MLRAVVWYLATIAIALEKLISVFTVFAHSAKMPIVSVTALNWIGRSSIAPTELIADGDQVGTGARVGVDKPAPVHASLLRSFPLSL